jgi:hypothetical protein
MSAVTSGFASSITRRTAEIISDKTGSKAPLTSRE